MGEAAKVPLQSAYAAPCLWVQARQRWPRHAGVTALPRAQEHPAHGPIHRNGARPVQGLLEGLTSRLGRISATASEGRWQRPDPWPRTLCLVNAADEFRNKLRRGYRRVRAPTISAIISSWMSSGISHMASG